MKSGADMEEGGQISHLILQIDTNAALLRNTTDVPRLG